MSAVSAHCDYGRVFDEQQPICNQTLLALFDELLLDLESFGVRHRARDPAPRNQTLIAIPRTALNASPTASYSVGCAWMV